MMPSDAALLRGVALVGSVTYHIRVALVVLVVASVLSMTLVALKDAMTFSKGIKATITAVKGAQNTGVPGSTLFLGWYEVSYSFSGNNYTGAVPASSGAGKGLGGALTELARGLHMDGSEGQPIEKDDVLRVGDTVVIRVKKSDPSTFVTSRMPLSAIWSSVSSCAVLSGLFALAAVLVIRKNRTLAASQGLRLV